MLVKKEFDKLVDGKQTPTLHATFSSLSSGNGIFRRKKSFAPSYTLLDMFENSREFDPFELSECFATVWRGGASPTHLPLLPVLLWKWDFPPLSIAPPHPYTPPGAI